MGVRRVASRIAAITALAVVAATGVVVAAAPAQAYTIARLSGVASTSTIVTASQNGSPVGTVRVADFIFTPTCTSGGCTTKVNRVRTDGTALNYTLASVSSASYRGSAHYTAGCFLNGGAEVAGAYVYDETLTITPTTSRAGYATSFTGTLNLTFEPTSIGSDYGCGAGFLNLNVSGMLKPFDCTTPGRTAKVYSPEYDARIRVRAAPDPTLFTFGPSLTACWNGAEAAWRSNGVFPEIHTGVVPFALSALGFDLEYDPVQSALYVDKQGSSAVAEATAAFYVRFNWASALAGVGIGKVGGKLEKPVAKELAKYFKRYGVKASVVTKALTKQARKLYNAGKGKVEGLPGILTRRGVPPKLAKYLGSKVLTTYEKAASPLRRWSGASVFPGIYRGESSKAYAKRLTGYMSSLVSARIPGSVRFVAWQPVYRYKLTPSGAITATDLKGFVNPFLGIHQTK